MFKWFKKRKINRQLYELFLTSQKEEIIENRKPLIHEKDIPEAYRYSDTGEEEFKEWTIKNCLDQLPEKFERDLHWFYHSQYRKSQEYKENLLSWREKHVNGKLRIATLQNSNNLANILTQIQAYKLPTPVCDYVFDAEKNYIFDLAWPDRCIAMDCDAALRGYWISEKNNRKTLIIREDSYSESFEKSCAKINKATSEGWDVYRFSSGQIIDGDAIKLLRSLELE